jgi:hypothetical protein
MKKHEEEIKRKTVAELSPFIANGKAFALIKAVKGNNPRIPIYEEVRNSVAEINGMLPVGIPKFRIPSFTALKQRFADAESKIPKKQREFWVPIMKTALIHGLQENKQSLFEEMSAIEDILKPELEDTAETFVEPFNVNYNE